MKKRIIALVLAMVSLFTVAPASAFAVGVEHSSEASAEAMPVTDRTAVNEEQTRHPMVGKTVTLVAQPGMLVAIEDPTVSTSGSIVGVKAYPERMEIETVVTVGDVTYYQLKAAEGSWPDYFGTVYEHYWLPATQVEEVQPACPDCGEKDCPGHTEQENPNTPSISATVTDASGKTQTVTVSGDALPDGAKLVVTQPTYKESLQGYVGQEIDALWSITVYDENGKEWQPDSPVRVMLTTSDENSKYAAVYHFLDTAAAVKRAINGEGIGYAYYADFDYIDDSTGNVLAKEIAAYQEGTGREVPGLALTLQLNLEIVDNTFSFFTDSFSLFSAHTYTAKQSSYGLDIDHRIELQDYNDTEWYATAGQDIYVDCQWPIPSTKNFDVTGPADDAVAPSGWYPGRVKVHVRNDAAEGSAIVISYSTATGTTHKINVLVVKEYTISYNANGGTVNGASSYTQNLITDDIGFSGLLTPTRTETGYNFLGWYTAASGGSKVTTWNGRQNLTLYAQWSYDVSYSLNGGSGTSDKQTINANNTVNLHGTPTRSGYMFLGWYSSADGVIYNGGATYSAKKPTTMTALWGKQSTASAWNHAFYVLPGTTTFTEQMRIIDGATRNTELAIGRPAIVADSNTYYVAPGTTMTFERSGGQWRVDNSDHAGITASVGTGWTATNTVTVAVGSTAVTGSDMMIYSRSATGTTVNCARIIVASKEDVTTMAINDTQNIYRVGVYILCDSTKIPGEPNYTSGVSMININGGMNYAASAAGIVYDSIATTAHYIPSLDGSCTMGVVDYTGRETVPYMDATLLNAAMDRVIQALAEGTVLTAADGANLKNLYDANGADYIRNNYAVRPHIAKLMTGLNYNELGWHIDCSVYPLKTVTLTYNLNAPAGYVLKNQGTPAPGIFTGDLETQVAEFTVTNNLGMNAVVTASVSGATDTASLTFKGWNTEPNGTGTAYAPGSTITLKEDVTLYAQWTGGDFNTGTLEIYKKVNVAAYSEQPNANDTFTFTVNLTGNRSYNIYNTQSGALVSSGTMTNGTFTLKDGQFIRFEMVPVATYTVEETGVPANYSMDAQSRSVVLKGGYVNHITFTNTYNKPLTFSVTYEYTGAVPNAADALPAASTKTYGDTVAVAAAPAAVPGYTFSGWTTADVTVSNGSFTMPAKAVKFTGNWTANEYDLYFDYNGGRNSETNATGISGPFPAKTGATSYREVTWLHPAREGYTFAGWYDEEGTKVYYGANDKDANGNSMSGYCIPNGSAYWDENSRWKGTDGLTLYAHWIPNEYKVTWVFGNGIENQVDTVTYGAAITEPADPARTGYNFTGWSPAVPDTMPAEDQTFTAQWEGKRYTLYVYATYGQPGKNSAYTVQYGKDFNNDLSSVITVPTGIRLKGLFTAQNSGGTQVYDGNAKYLAGTYWDELGHWQYEGNLTVYADWERIEYAITYVDTLAQTSTTETYDAWDTAHVLKNAESREGYNFKGWIVKETTGTWPVGTTYEAGTQTWGYSGDVTLETVWEVAYVDLTIRTTCDDKEQSFVFDIVGQNGVELTVILVGDDEKTVVELPVGTYTVTERTKWSWRQADVAAKTVELKQAGQTVDFSFGAAEEDRWLSAFSYAFARFVKGGGNG